MDKMTQLRAFLQKTPNDSFLQHALALEHIKRGEEAEAKQLFENILAQDPTYIGSYYHLGKLLERINDAPAAVDIYEKGMAQSRAAGDNHAYNELQAAHEDLTD